jgi:hypothetical protein
LDICCPYIYNVCEIRREQDRSDEIIVRRKKREVFRQLARRPSVVEVSGLEFIAKP